MIKLKLMPKNQQGIVHIAIIVIFALGILASVFYIKKNFLDYTISLTNLSAKNVSIKKSSSPSPSLRIITQTGQKPTSSPTSSPSVSPTPSAVNSSPTPTSSPQSGVYKVTCEENCVFTMKINSGYAVFAKLSDTNGNVIADQTDFEYTWTIDNPDIGSFGPFDACVTGVKTPCPFDHAVVNAFKTGEATIKAVVTKKSEGKTVGETTFHFSVY